MVLAPALLAASCLALASGATEIRIGFLFPRSNTSWQQESWSQLKLAVQDVNADAALLTGYELKPVMADSGASPMDALRSAAGLLSAGVVAIVGPADEAFVSGAATHCSLMGTPMLSPSSTSVAYTDKSGYPFLFRTMPSDSGPLKAMAVLVYELGWRRVAIVANSLLVTGVTSVLQPALEALTVRVLALTYPPTAGGDVGRLGQALNLVNASGHRVIALYGEAADAAPVHAAAQAADLGKSFISWVMTESTYTGPWLTTANVLVAMRTDPAPNPVRDAFVARWPNVSIRYDASIHGAFDPATKLPFYGNARDVWDTASSAVAGDGVPDPKAAVAYDTVRILALALNQLVQAGGLPADGAALHSSLLNVSYAGVSGRIAFDQVTQDSTVFVPLVFSHGDATPPLLIGRTTDRLDAASISSSGWCASGCLDASSTALGRIPWPGGSTPEDGRGVDPKISTYSLSTRWNEGQDFYAIVYAVDSFGVLPCDYECPGRRRRRRNLGRSCTECKTIQGYDRYSLRAYDMSGRRVRSTGWGYYEYVWPYKDMVLVGASQGWDGASNEDRRLRCDLRYDGRVVLTQNFTLRSKACQLGQATFGGTVCADCLPGQVAPTRGLVNCTPCGAGTVQPQPGQSSCVGCAPGRFQDSEGALECSLCPIGRYQPDQGQVQCLPCPSPMTTVAFGSVDLASCMCPPRTFRPANATLRASMRAFPCLACPEGMECQGASDERKLLSGAESLRPEITAPLVLPSYWSTGKEPMSIHRCLGGALQCPGGKPTTCGPRLRGKVCALCDEGYYRDGGACVQCPDQALSKFVFPSMPVIVSLIIVPIDYRMQQNDGIRTWNRDVKSAAYALALASTYLQIGGLILKCNVQMPQAGSMSRFWVMINTPLSLLQLECAGVRSFQATLAFGMFLPLYVGFIFVSFAVISALLSMCIPRARLNLSVLLSCYGSLFLTFYVSVVAISTDLFKCYRHPNGVRSVVSAPNIICQSPEWRKMTTAASAAAILYCGSSLAIFCWALMNAPRFRKSGMFQKTFKFLLARFRPAERWWSIVLLIKAFLLNMVQVMIDRGQDQLVSFQFLLSVYGALVVWRQPWRHTLVNAVDAGLHCLLAFACSLLYWYGAVPTGTPDLVRSMFVQQIVLPVPFGALLLFVAYKKLRTFLNARRGHKRQTVTAASLDAITKNLSDFANLKPDVMAELLDVISPQDRAQVSSVCEALQKELPEVLDRNTKALRDFEKDFEHLADEDAMDPAAKQEASEKKTSSWQLQDAEDEGGGSPSSPRGALGELDRRSAVGDVMRVVV